MSTFDLESMMPRTLYASPRRFLSALISALFVSLALSTAARAGTYEVYSCDPNRGGATPGWNVSVSDGFTVYGNCGNGNTEGLVARSVPGGTASAFQHGAAYFDAPAGTTIDSLHAYVNLDRYGCNWGAGVKATNGDFGGRWVFALTPGYCGTNTWSWTYFDWAINDKRVVLMTICGASSCDRTQESRASIRNVRITINDPTPPSLTNPGGELWSAAGWVNGSRQVSFDASDGAGIRKNLVRLDDQVLQVAEYACNDTQPSPCPNQGLSITVDTSKITPDGPHKLTLETVDAAGNPTQTSKTIQVDNTAPAAPDGLAIEGGDGWRSGNGFTATWTNPSDGGGAPIASAEYRLCRASGGDCTTGRVDGASVSRLESLQLPAPGEWKLTVTLRDAAGNLNTAAAAEALLRFDPTAPEVAFESPNPSDPTLVTARASDADSGVVDARIEIRKRGADSWQTLPSTLEGGVVHARIDDEHLASGRYQLRAWAKDAAGNERSSTDLADGGNAVVRLPVRVRTEIKASAASRHGRKRSSTVRARFGKPVRLGGQLRTADGNPVANSEVLIFSRDRRPGAPWTAVASVKTSKRGFFNYRAPRGVSRTIRFRFSGTATIRPSLRHITLLVPARSTIHADRTQLINGEYVHLRGHVLGGSIPGEGKLVEIQVLLRGQWHTFATTRTGVAGRWRYEYRFDGTRGNQTYRMRARLPQESAFPFAVGHSRALRLHVRGL